jgi:hypothetical protein
MMSQPNVQHTKGGSSRLIWLIGLGIALVFLWLIYSATQSSTTSNSMSMLGMGGTATAMPQSMPGMNH